MYSRAQCALCRDAETVLAKTFGRKHLRIIDITENQDLENRYIFRIPVVEVAGNVVAEGVIGPDEIRTIRAASRGNQRSPLR